LKNFRNIEDACFSPEREVNVVFGQNGQGKTNLLESIYILTGAKSYRTRNDTDMIKRDSEFGIVQSKFFLKGREQQLRLTLSSKGRQAELNRGGTTRASELEGLLCCVLFSPEHLMLVKGDPGQRRKFMDFALCQLSSKYLGEMKKYIQLTRQKNSILKNYFQIPDVYDLLDVYDVQIVEAAAEISLIRKDYCERLLSLAKKDYGAISSNGERLDLFYSSSLWNDCEISIESGLDRLIEARKNDLRVGYMTVGPHRDDLIITLDGADSRVFASQGQQRSVVLALKLAESTLMERTLGERPLLLLDDVLSELDAQRQEFLLLQIKEGQSIITCCDPTFIKGRITASLFEMRDGRLFS
ncbi:MAG: DNA replication/repair protein RecF, partial [Oscillospiraceae bacterium]|nr:DNA replication/repair protein RecF [Oscillospiraceae bacterium]